jgi:hypothetical protein
MEMSDLNYGRWQGFPPRLRSITISLFIKRHSIGHARLGDARAFLKSQNSPFYPKRFFLECREKVNSETFPEKVPSWAFDATDKDYIQPKPSITNAVWSKLIEKYSRYKLTFARDKLVAISGLAQIFQVQINHVYVAGLWKKDLEFQLLWEAVEPDERPLPPTAPSRSWASLRGAVTFSKQTGHARYRSCCTLASKLNK